MPARNNVEDIIKEFNNKVKEFGLESAEVLNYQNLKESSIVMYNLKKEKIIKSAQSWRVFFSQLTKLKQTNETLAFEKTKAIQNEETAYQKRFEKAKERNHEILNLKYNKTVKHSTFTVFCNFHKKIYKKIHFKNYMHPTVSFGVPCCSSKLRTRKKPG